MLLKKLVLFVSLTVSAAGNSDENCLADLSKLLDVSLKKMTDE